MSKQEWTRESLLKACSDFRDAFNYIKNNWSSWDAAISEYDKMLSDIYHEVEFNYPKGRPAKTKACTLMKKTLDERRKYKDLREIFKKLYDIEEKQRSTLMAAIKEMEKQGQFVNSKRSYHRRVLSEEDFW